MEVTQQTGTIYWTILERGYISDLSNTLQMLCNPFKYKQLNISSPGFLFSCDIGNQNVYC